MDLQISVFLLFIVFAAGEIISQVSIKNCAIACENGSMNLGVLKTSYSCCDTDLCNAKDDTDVSSIVPNGKRCYYCDGHSCVNVMSCSGSEDRCVTATESFGGQSTVVKGCVSKSFCDAAASVGEVQSFSCCSEDLCNGVQSVPQSFLFLACSLLSFILLH
ncbi:urokinase plasminogen activator surface receptor-like [Puntigrus tetrazona]|uniref:urokinase plasminogen activator surface receptor-like n=1 Tax=Puntigrus tetrazona TaxID=1606681 RepID=UPI001C8A2885|nr:urokinase plasminogen activator surface receptor-like [Puntigrus tetrazona]